MGGAVAEILCSLFISIGFIGVIVAIANPAWEVQDLETTPLPGNAKYKGLWRECWPDSSAKVTCEVYKAFFLGLEAKIQAGRGFSITALFMGLFSFLLCATSISSINCSSKNSATRNRIRLLGSALGLLAGISVLIGVSWYASTVMKEYYQVITGEAMVPGEAIYIGFTAAVFFIFGGIVGFCISCQRGDEEDRDQPRVFYQPHASKEYV